MTDAWAAFTYAVAQWDWPAMFTAVDLYAQFHRSGSAFDTPEVRFMIAMAQAVANYSGNEPEIESADLDVRVCIRRLVNECKANGNRVAVFAKKPLTMDQQRLLFSVLVGMYRQTIT